MLQVVLHLSLHDAQLSEDSLLLRLVQIVP
jgi:hypothetical protein